MSALSLRLCTAEDFEGIWEIVNDGAQAYRGIIPEDRWTEPYMSRKALQHEITEGVTFWGAEENGCLRGVMGLQAVRDVMLVRHAYVRSASQGKGVGSSLLDHLRSMTCTPILIGTWADAAWAIGFYLRHGFSLTSLEEKERLLRTYWCVPDRQIETSVVLADQAWRAAHPIAS